MNTNSNVDHISSVVNQINESLGKGRNQRHKFKRIILDNLRRNLEFLEIHVAHQKYLKGFYWSNCDVNDKDNTANSYQNFKSARNALQTLKRRRDDLVEVIKIVKLLS